MADLIKIIILIIIIFASACACIWYGLGSPTYLSAKVRCDLNEKSIEVSTFQTKLFGYVCQK